MWYAISSYNDDWKVGQVFFFDIFVVLYHCVSLNNVIENAQDLAEFYEYLGVNTYVKLWNIVNTLGSRAAERLCCVMLPRFWLFWTTFTILNSSEIELKQGPSTWITHVSSDAWNLWIKIPKYVYGFLPWYLLCCKLDTLHQPRWPSLNRTPACDWLLCVLTGYLV